MPSGVPWEIWRIVLSSEIPDGLPVVSYLYTMTDIARAHEMLDAIEAARSRAQ